MPTETAPRNHQEVHGTITKLDLETMSEHIHFKFMLQPAKGEPFEVFFRPVGDSDGYGALIIVTHMVTDAFENKRPVTVQLSTHKNEHILEKISIL